MKDMKNPIKEKEKWQIDVSHSVFPRRNEEETLTYFLPMSPSKRPTPHNKVNECDY